MNEKNLKKKEALKKKIDKLQAELDELEKLSNRSSIRDLSSYSKLEKLTEFDAFYNMALEHLDDIENGKGHARDDEIWFYEAVMDLLAKDQSFWKYYNSLI